MVVDRLCGQLLQVSSPWEPRDLGCLSDMDRYVRNFLDSTCCLFFKKEMKRETNVSLCYFVYQSCEGSGCCLGAGYAKVTD
jgi:hypothetical protein